MRLLFVNQYYPPDSSATAYLLAELSQDLAEHHEVWVVAGRPSYNPTAPTAAAEAPTGVHLIRSWSTSFSRSGMAGRLANYATFAMTSFWRALTVPRPDVVVAMTDPPLIGLIGLLAARRHRAPFVYVCQDIFPDVAVALGRMDNALVVRTWRWLNRRLRRGASRIVAIGRDMVEKLEAEGVPPGRIALIPNWADDPSVDPAAVTATREAMGWRGRYVAMHAGNVGLAQHLGTVIGAAERLADLPTVRIVIMGDGAARAALEERVGRLGLANVEFVDSRPKSEAQALLAAADLHLISLAPGLWGSVVPSKLYGILALGKPFVAAVEAGSEVARIAEDAGAGVQVEPGDESALAQAVSAFVTGEADGAAMGVRGRAEFEARCLRSLATSAYRRLLEEAAGDGRPELPRGR